MVSGIIWGGSGIEKVLFDFIRERVEPGSVVIELGAGVVSTKALSGIYKLYSVEHDPDYINLIEGVNYIYAPEYDGWYNIEKLKALPERDTQKLILVDGHNRSNILKYLFLFNPDALYIIHDTYREKEQRLAIDLGKSLKRPVTFYQEGDYWAAI